MSRAGGHRRSARAALVITLAVVLQLALVAAGISALSSSPIAAELDLAPEPAPSTATPAPAAPAPAAPATPITLAFAGDVHFEGGVAALLDRDDATLGPLSQALYSADVAVVNLESALTTRDDQASKNLEDPSLRYWFRTPPEALRIFERSGVDAVSMANNHGADFGADGLRDSLRAARGSKVGVLGIGANPAQAYKPYVKNVRGVEVAVLAADASKLESRSAIWNVGANGPGMARADNRLVTAVRQAAARYDVVVTYLHWGEEGERCPTPQQQNLAKQLSGAGADVIVGAHAHLLQGAGMLGTSYVSYGLGNFVWYHGSQAETGVLRVQVSGGKVTRDDWVPGRIPQAGGQPRPVNGSARTAAVRDWRALRGCTDLAPGPTGTAAVDRTDSGTPPAAPPAYASSVQAIPTELQRRMNGSSHDAARCPVPLDDLRLLTVSYVDFAGKAQSGQLIVHRDHADDIVSVFGELYRAKFPIRQMRLVDDYGGDDNASMAADNTSAYNCRTVAGQTTFSRHAYGAAVDINPVENPYLTGGEVLPPAGRAYAAVNRDRGARAGKGVIVADDVVTRAFARIGWQWGGSWTDRDFQHFDTR